jgi:hypothetical protein
MLLSTGFIQTNRQALRDLFKLIDATARQGRGRPPSVTNARLVIYAIIDNTGYTDTPDGRMHYGVWRTTYNEISDYTGLSKGQVRRTLKFIASINRQGENPLISLKNIEVTEVAHEYPTPLSNNRQGKRRITDTLGIEVLTLFYRGLTEVAHEYPTPLDANNRHVITKKDFKEKEKKAVPARIPPNPVHGRPEQTPGENGKVKKGKNGGLRIANNEIADNPEIQSPNDHGHEDPVEPALQTNRRREGTTQIGSEITKQTRQIERTTEGKPNLTAQRGGITLVEAIEKYPELEKSVKYLTRLDKICETLHPTHLDKFKRLVQADIIDPKTNGSELIGILDDFRKSDLHFDTVKPVIDRILTDRAPRPTELPVAQLSVS